MYPNSACSFEFSISIWSLPLNDSTVVFPERMSETWVGPMVKVKMQKKPALSVSEAQTRTTHTAARPIICPSTESDLLSDIAMNIRM